jgi:hypothetical protein
MTSPTARTWTIAALAGILTGTACARIHFPFFHPKPKPPVAAPAPAPVPIPAGTYRVLPDPALTPGAVLPVTAADVCQPGYASKTRNVPYSVKREVYKRYGIKHHGWGEYEVDHLISLELGGSNDVANLWPQAYGGQPWNALVKDRLERELHRRVCAGLMTLAEAQSEIRTDWTACYTKVFGKP